MNRDEKKNNPEVSKLFCVGRNFESAGLIISHLNRIFPRNTSAGFIFISFSVSAIARTVMPIGVAQFNLICRTISERTMLQLLSTVTARHGLSSKRLR